VICFDDDEVYSPGSKPKGPFFSPHAHAHVHARAHHHLHDFLQRLYLKKKDATQ
jgi:hypothetical protein